MDATAWGTLAVVALAGGYLATQKGWAAEGFNNLSEQQVFMAQQAIRRNKLNTSAFDEKQKVWMEFNELNRLPAGNYIHQEKKLIPEKDRREYNKVVAVLSSTASYGPSTSYSTALMGLKTIWDKHLTETLLNVPLDNAEMTQLILNLGEAIDFAKSSKKYQKAYHGAAVGRVGVEMIEDDKGVQSALKSIFDWQRLGGERCRNPLSHQLRFERRYGKKSISLQLPKRIPGRPSALFSRTRRFRPKAARDVPLITRELPSEP